MIAIKAIGDNVDVGDNAADAANFFALEHNRWNAPRRTSYTIIEIVLPFPENRFTCFPPHGESLTHMVKSPDHVFPLAHMHKSPLTQMHKSPTEAEFTCSRAPEPSDCPLF